MKNWLDQEIAVDDIVYRGARDGNSSSFKIGKVVKLSADKGTARVEWIMDQHVAWQTNAGTCGIDTLFKTTLTEQEVLDLRERRWDEYIFKMQQRHPNYNPTKWF